MVFFFQNFSAIFRQRLWFWAVIVILNSKQFFDDFGGLLEIRPQIGIFWFISSRLLALRVPSVANSVTIKLNSIVILTFKLGSSWTVWKWLTFLNLTVEPPNLLRILIQFLPPIWMVRRFFQNKMDSICWPRFFESSSSIIDGIWPNFSNWNG